jgi:hypothetical protein
LTEPEDDGGGEGDGAEEDGSSAVVACGDTAPILEPAEHDLDAVALAIQRGVVRDGHLPTAGGWDAGGDAALGESGAKSGRYRSRGRL